MDRDTGRVALIALLCCLAVVLAAATLPSMIESDGTGIGDGGDGSGGGTGGTGGTGDGGIGSDGSAGGDSEPWLDVGSAVPELCIGFLDSDGALLGLVLGTVGLAALTTRSYDRSVTIALVIALLPLVVLGVLLLTSGCGTAVAEPPAPESEMTPLEENGTADSPGGDGGGALPGPTLPSLLVVAVLLVTIGAAIAALFYTGDGDRRQSTASPADATDDAQRSAFGRAAGQAADRIESGNDFENDVYRAWRELTEPLDVERPAASTPGEFAAAARDAGVDPADVDALRTLFEDVRYGDRPVTADRERRAVELLRRIEDADGENGETRR
ncbi:DUF4129 domain-containing protein [Natrinema salifodinae]|uniref:Protein-glutamine gamma-glutamyltransferase-like C-terminal domain-containing protein n=1 Tax=Natrinema salifodinae TaxID=1202768 RepID=A0A1I0MI80_9EURY|nr:DUF4129 domain-containing protein [Natrinema salifodinae]SEV87526.1 protein of unknown function [Natrinema salifodinae]